MLMPLSDKQPCEHAYQSDSPTSTTPVGQQSQADGVKRIGGERDHDPHSAQWLIEVGERWGEEKDKMGFSPQDVICCLLFGNDVLKGRMEQTTDHFFHFLPSAQFN